MGDDDGGRACLTKNCERIGADGVLEARIEPGKRLVHQEHARARGERPGQGHALLFAARQGMRKLVGVVGKPDPLQGRHGLGDGILARQGRQAEADIVQHAHVRKEREILEHQANAAFFRRKEGAGACDLAVVDQHASGGLGLDAGRNPQKRRLARSGGTEQAQDFAGSAVRVSPRIVSLPW